MKIEEWNNIQSEVATLRSEFLQTSVEIDELLTKVLATLITGSEDLTDQAEAVRWDVLQQFGVTFSMRIEILRSLGERRSDAGLKALPKKIDVVRKRRNILAHGNWTTIIVGGGFAIEHVKNGKLEREVFDAAKRKRWQSHAEGVLALLFETFETINPIYFAELLEEMSR